MNVLHINCNYMSTALHQTMIEHLDELGLNNLVFAPIYSEKNSVIRANNNVIVSKCFKKTDRFVFYYKQMKIRRALEKAVSSTDYNCIHAYTLFTDGNVAYELSKKYGIPYCVAIRSTDVNVFLKKIKYLRGRGIDILRSASAVFFLSETYQEQVLSQYVPQKYQKEVRDKSYIVPNGIDDFWFENLNVERNSEQKKKDFSEKKLKVSYVGAIIKRKNVGTTVKALTLLQNEGWDIEYTVAGKNQNDKEFELLKQFDGLNYLGKLSREDVIKCYRKCDIFVMPSHHETFGLSYAEAMSQGLPVIYSKGQGFDGQFKDGVVGFAVAARDEKEIVQAIKKITFDYDTISQNCIKYVDKFRWSEICKQYLRIYEKCSYSRK